MGPGEPAEHAAIIPPDPLDPGAVSSSKDPDAAGPEEGIALCCSGGGFRAMLFHVGVLWRLNEAGVLKELDRISCVSGGSITGGMLALAWGELAAEGFSQDVFVRRVAQSIREFAYVRVDAKAVIAGAMLPFVSSDDFIASAYREHLFGRKTLQDIPDHPRFVFNATNVQSGALVRFSKPYLWDWRVGKIAKPDIELAIAVGASSAFPPFLSPVILKCKHAQFEPGSGTDLQKPPYTTRMVLTDGGVYDNLGLETAFKRCRTLLVSDAGGQMQPDESPNEDWGRHSKRVLDMVDNQVRNLRKRQLLDALTSSDDGHRREGAFFSIRSDMNDFKLPTSLPAPFERTQELAQIPTRLDAVPSTLQERLINWGYAISDAAIRRYWRGQLSPPRGLPYVKCGV